LLYTIIALVVFAYILGSIPFGLVVGKTFYRTDIRNYGSGNIGATNVFRNLGPMAGVLVWIADVLKGLVPVLLVRFVLSQSPEAMPLVGVITGVAAVFGHTHSVFLRFSGGKGMSTTGGMTIGLWPWAALILFLTWVVMLAVTRYSSVASLTLAIGLPVLVSIFYPKTEYIIFSIMLAAILIYKHRSNISRLISGKELRLGVKPKTEDD